MTQKELHDELFKLRLERFKLEKENKDTSYIDDQIEKIKKQYAKSKAKEINENGKYKK